jgi:hypothetical protein
MPSQYFDTANHRKSQCDFAFKADHVPKLWATIWSSLDLYQLLISNQLLIKSNPNEHQYKSNWYLIGGSFYKKSLFDRDTEL